MTFAALEGVFISSLQFWHEARKLVVVARFSCPSPSSATVHCWRPSIHTVENLELCMHFPILDMCQLKNARTFQPRAKLEFVSVYTIFEFHFVLSVRLLIGSDIVPISQSAMRDPLWHFNLTIPLWMKRNQLFSFCVCLLRRNFSHFTLLLCLDGLIGYLTEFVRAFNKLNLWTTNVLRHFQIYHFCLIYPCTYILYYVC